MKKTLFVLGAFAAMSLVGCNGKNDCACAILDTEGSVFVASEKYVKDADKNKDVGTSLDVTDFDGECSDVVWEDLQSSKWAGMGSDFALKCKEM